MNRDAIEDKIHDLELERRRLWARYGRRKKSIAKAIADRTKLQEDISTLGAKISTLRTELAHRESILRRPEAMAALAAIMGE